MLLNESNDAWYMVFRRLSYDKGLSEIIEYNLISKPSWTLLLLNTACPVLVNSVDPDQLASEETNWSGSALFVFKYVNFYQKPESSNLIGWKLEVGGHLNLFSKANVTTQMHTEILS